MDHRGKGVYQKEKMLSVIRHHHSPIGMHRTQRCMTHYQTRQLKYGAKSDIRKAYNQLEKCSTLKSITRQDKMEQWIRVDWQVERDKAHHTTLNCTALHRTVTCRPYLSTAVRALCHSHQPKSRLYKYDEVEVDVGRLGIEIQWEYCGRAQHRVTRSTVAYNTSNTTKSQKYKSVGAL